MAQPRSEILEWAGQGRIAPRDLRRALALGAALPDGEAWRRFLDRLLLFAGVVLLAAAVVFFFAYNWRDLGRLAKFALAQAPIGVALVVVWRLGLDGLAGKAALLAASLFAGALLALVGQAYQTGADTSELFAAWAAAILPWVLLARLAALWILWLTLVNLAVVLYFTAFQGLLGVAFGPERELWLLLGIDTAALIAWEIAGRRVAWLQARWAPRLLASACLGIATTLAVMTLVAERNASMLNGAAWLAWIAGAYAAYVHARRDLYVLAGGALSVIVVATVLLVKSMPLADAGALLFVGLAIIGLSAAAGYWLRTLAGRDETPVREDGSPWYVRAMLGVAGWIGALFLLGFVGAAFAVVVKSATALTVAGICACALAAALFRVPGDFVSQFSFAVALAGQVLLGAGLVQTTQGLAGTALVLAVQQALLFFLLPSFLHRVWAAWSGSLALLFALDQAGLAGYGPALLCAAFALAWLREFDYGPRAKLVRAGGYGVALAIACLVVMQTPMLFPGWLGLRHADVVNAPQAWAGVAAGVVLIAAVAALLRREGVALGSAVARVALAAAIALAVVTLKAPGIVPPVLVLVLGYANGNRVLAGVGIAALIAYLSHYYYWMQVSLLEKSMVLTATGCALLAARFALQRWWPADERHA